MQAKGDKIFKKNFEKDTMLLSLCLCVQSIHAKVELTYNSHIICRIINFMVITRVIYGNSCFYDENDASSCGKYFT